MNQARGGLTATRNNLTATEREHEMSKGQLPKPTPFFIFSIIAGLIGGMTLMSGCAENTPLNASMTATPTPSVEARSTQEKLAVVKRGNLRGITYGAAIAEALGYFRDVGIDDQEIVFKSGPEQTQALASGQVDIATSSNTAAFFNANAQGIHQPFVCDNWHLERGDRSMMLVVRPDLADSIKSLSDLSGRVNATSNQLRDGGSNFQADKMLQASGLQLDDVKWVQLPFPDMLTALSQKRVDVAWEIEPFITLGKEKGLLVPWLALSDYDPGFQVAGIVYSEKFMKERPDVAKRWMVANLRGLKDYNDFLQGRKRDIIGPILAKHTGLSLEQVNKVAFPPIRADGRLNVESVMQAQQKLRDWGTIKTTLTADQVVNHEFVEYAQKQLDEQP